jgi:hypothetical protein
LRLPKKSFGDREDANGTPDAPSFNTLQVLLSNLEEKILMVMEYMIKMMSRSCWFKRIQRLS